MTWEPISLGELAELLEVEIGGLTPVERAAYERFSVEPEVVQRIFERSPSDEVPTYVIARDGSHVLFYDDIEEEWGTANLAPDGRIHDWGTSGERLRWALGKFAKPRDHAPGVIDHLSNDR